MWSLFLWNMHFEKYSLLWFVTSSHSYIKWQESVIPKGKLVQKALNFQYVWLDTYQFLSPSRLQRKAWMSNPGIPKGLKSHAKKSKMQSSKKMGMYQPASLGLPGFRYRLQSWVFLEFMDWGLRVNTQLMITDFLIRHAFWNFGFVFLIASECCCIYCLLSIDSGNIQSRHLEEKPVPDLFSRVNFLPIVVGRSDLPTNGLPPLGDW